MKLLKLIAKISAGILSLGILFVVMLIIINLPVFDEELNPEFVTRVKSFEMPEIEGNAYVAIWGLKAKSENSVLESGKELLIRYGHNLEQGEDEITREDYQAVLGKKSLDKEWKEQIVDCNDRERIDCAAVQIEQLNSEQMTYPRLELMLARYDEIVNMQFFKSVNYFGMATPLPDYGTLLALQKIKLAQAYEQESVSEFVQVMENDFHFWRMLLTQGETVMDKMVAAAGLLHDVRTVSSYLVTHQNLGKIEQNRFSNLLKALTPEELDISEAFLEEHVALLSSIKKYGRVIENNASLSNLLLQPNATINLAYEYFVQNLPSYKLTSRQLAKQIAENETGCCVSEQSSISFSPKSLYNIMGKYFFSEVLTGMVYNDYVLRVHDLNGMFSLVRLQLELLENKQISVQDVINQSVNKNPYTDNPMEFDPAQMTLEFECLSVNYVCKIMLSE